MVRPGPGRGTVQLNGRETVYKRDENGRFASGNGGGPGRPPRATEERYQDILKEAVTFAQFKRIIQTMAKKAEKGDTTATRLLMEYIIGKPAQTLLHGNTGEGPLRVVFGWADENCNDSTTSTT